MARSPVFDGVDPELLQLLRSVGESYGPYGFSVKSGYRAGDPRQHGKGRALDVNLIDRKTNQALADYQSPETAKAYQQYANAVYAAASPEMKEKLRWGGYFGGGKGDYGALDLMHFDTAGGPGGLGMKGGGWDTGWTPEMLKTWGIEADAMGPPSSAKVTPEQIQQAFLASISGTESPGYDVMYGGGKFTDYSQHPNQRIPIKGGPNAGAVSTAAGKYQMLYDTWNRAQQELGLKDFSPASQDQAAWWLANQDYSQRTKGGDLAEALASGDPARINAAAQVLNKTWTSLPGGIEQNSGYGNSTFYDTYLKNLGGDTGSSAPSTGGSAVASSGSSGRPSTDIYGLDKKDPKEEAIGDATDALEDMASARTMGAKGAAPSLPASPLIPGQVQPNLNAQSGDMNRQRLAMAMARLGTGRLWT